MRSGIRHAAGRLRMDVLRGLVGLHQRVERPGVGREEGARHGVCRDALLAALGVDVARPVPRRGSARQSGGREPCESVHEGGEKHWLRGTTEQRRRRQADVDCCPVLLELRHLTELEEPARNTQPCHRGK